MTFSPTDINRTITLNITDEMFVEGDEVITLFLTNFSSVIKIGQQTTNITIEDNDSKPLGSGREVQICITHVPVLFPLSVATVGFSNATYIVVESGGYVEVCVQPKSGSLSSGGFVAISINTINTTSLTASETHI